MNILFIIIIGLGIRPNAPGMIINGNTTYIANPDSIPLYSGIVDIAYSADVDSGSKSAVAFSVSGRYNNFTHYSGGLKIQESPLSSSWLKINGHRSSVPDKYYAIEGILTDTLGDSMHHFMGVGIYTWARMDCYAGSRVGTDISLYGFKGYVYGKEGTDNSLTGLGLYLSYGSGSKRGISIDISGKSGADIYGDIITVSNDSDNINYAVYGSKRIIYSNNNQIFGYYSDVHDTSGTRAGYCFYGSMTGGSGGALSGIYIDSIPEGVNNYAGYFKGAIKVTGKMSVNTTGRFGDTIYTKGIQDSSYIYTTGNLTTDGNLSVTGFIIGSAKTRGIFQFGANQTVDTVDIDGLSVSSVANANPRITSDSTKAIRFSTIGTKCITNGIVLDVAIADTQWARLYGVNYTVEK